MNGGRLHRFISVCQFLLLPCVCSAGDGRQHGDLFAIAASTPPAAVELHLSRLDVLGYASRPSFVKTFSGNTTFRGDVAEAWASQAAIGEYLAGVGRPGGNWVPLSSHEMAKSGAARAQGIDHVFLKLREDGIPQDIFIGETKWGTARLEEGLGPEKDIDQMSRDWIDPKLKAIAEEYLDFAKAGNIRFAETAPPGRAIRELQLSPGKTRKTIRIWKGKDGLWYCDGNAGDIKAIQDRANTYGRVLQGAADGTIGTRTGLFHLSPDGNDIVFTHRVTKSADKVTALDPVDFQTRIPRAWVGKGTVSLDVIESHLRKAHKNWDAGKIRSEAKKLQENLSAQELIDQKQKLNLKAIREGVGTSVRAGAFAFALTAAFSSWKQYAENGNRFSDWDWGKIGTDSTEMAALTTTAVGIGQGTTYLLAGRQILGRTIGTTAAKRVGGVVTATLFSAYAFRRYLEGEASLMDASVEAGITASSFAVSSAILAMIPNASWTGPYVVAALAAGAAVAYAGERGYAHYKDYKLFFADSEEWKVLIDLYLDNPDFIFQATEKHVSGISDKFSHW